MLSRAQFRQHLYSAFDIMTAGGMIEVYVGNKVYEMTLKSSDKRVIRKYTQPPKRIVSITEKKCQDCGFVMFEGLCMNRECKSVSDYSFHDIEAFR